MEVGLHAMQLVRAGEVRRELRAELLSGLDRPGREVHEPSPGGPGQGNVKVTRHDGVITPSRGDGGDVDLQELRWVGVVTLRQEYPLLQDKDEGA